MNWKGILGIALSCLMLGLAGGLLIGMRGCGGGVSKLLAENAELKAEVTRFKFLASEAEESRAIHARRRHDAERVAAALQEQNEVTTRTVADLRKKVARAGHKKDERDDLIVALELDGAVKDKRIDLLQAALNLSKEAEEAEFQAHSHTKSALTVSESRAGKLEKGLMKERPKKILIGVGSAVGASLLTLGSVYAAGKL